MSVSSQKNKPDSRHGISTLPWRSLTWQFIFITLLPLTVLVLVITFGSLAVHQNAMRSLVGERDVRYVRTVAAALDEQINHRLISVRGLSIHSDQVDTSKIPSLLAASEDLLAEFDTGLAIFDPVGRAISTIGEAGVWEELSKQIPALLQSWPDESNDLTYLSGALTHPINGEPVVLIMARSPSHTWIAVGASTAKGLVSHTLSNIFTEGSSASVAVFDTNRRLIYESGVFTYSDEVGKHPGIAEALNGESGTTYIQVEGSEHVVAYSPLPTLGWALVTEEAWEMVADPTLRSSQLAPLVLVPVVVLSLVAFWFGARQIVRPLQQLESKAATLARGDFQSIESPVGGIEEIRQLQSELVQMAHKVQASQKSLHGYIGAITMAQEEERRRLARELHDDTIQALIALKQRIQIAQLADGSNVHLEESATLQEVASLTEQTIENLRRLTRALRPIYLEDLGLVTALEMLARETGQAIGIPVEFHKQGVEVRLVPAVELALYRIAQEACSNIARHAQAKRASLHIRFSPKAVTVEVSDDGVGFEVPKGPAEFAPSGHFGLLGLYERAELISATLEIRSTPGRGTHLKILLPLSS